MDTEANTPLRFNQPPQPKPETTEREHAMTNPTNDGRPAPRHLTAAERETTITYSDADLEAGNGWVNIWTCRPVDIRALDKIANLNDGRIEIVNRTTYSGVHGEEVQYRVAARYFRAAGSIRRAPRELTPEQRQTIANRLTKARNQ